MEKLQLIPIKEKWKVNKSFKKMIGYFDLFVFQFIII